MSSVVVTKTAIEGLLEITIPVHGDERGWFKENWQIEKMRAAGLPELAFVQQNVAFNRAAGVTRGIHAEPWDKYVSVACGRVYAAIVDLREGPGFGTVSGHELTPDKALLIPVGCGNSYQVLEPATAYIYLTTGLWSAGMTYPAVSPMDAELAIDWPLSGEQAVLSAKDLAAPPLAEFIPLGADFGSASGAGQ
ncbi:MAG: dTDP-4-dehydrorhamnose reductase [Mycobacterium sp.]|nr:dTDP-4-dehydrorhamnose reductase [Mycobacterium sp.]